MASCWTRRDITQVIRMAADIKPMFGHDVASYSQLYAAKHDNRCLRFSALQTASSFDAWVTLQHAYSLMEPLAERSVRKQHPRSIARNLYSSHWPLGQASCNQRGILPLVTVLVWDFAKLIRLRVKGTGGPAEIGQVDVRILTIMQSALIPTPFN